MDRNGKNRNIERKRGRPAGKNRIPLSREERRARNAQYERERRNETAEAFAELARAVGCDPAISNSELLATVIGYIQGASVVESNDNVEVIRNTNERLLAQVSTLKQQLAEHSATAVPTQDLAIGFTVARTTPDEVLSNFETPQTSPAANAEVPDVFDTLHEFINNYESDWTPSQLGFDWLGDLLPET